jgi:hypothetical protein
MPEIRGEAPMSSLFERGKEAARDERAIRSLLDRTDAPAAQVRTLFAQEFSRLELGAKVRSYLGVLTASNVRSMLRRRTGSSMNVSPLCINQDAAVRVRAFSSAGADAKRYRCVLLYATVPSA